MDLPTQPSLLLIDGHPETACLLQETLAEHFGAGCVRHVTCVEDACRVDVRRIDLVLSDMNLPDGAGLDVLSRLLLRRPDLPVVLVTGDSVLENAIAAIRRGAYDYVVKAGDYLFTIPLIVEKNLAIWRTKQDNLCLQAQLTRTLEEVRIKNAQLEEAVRRLETVAATDPLTGLANRRAFGETLMRCFAEVTRHRQDLACLMIDLDGFKEVNDVLGHQRGDELLQAAARALQSSCRRSDAVARFGGDEFIVLLPQATEPVARQVARRIQHTFAEQVAGVLGDAAQAHRVTMSLGLTCLRQTGAVQPEQLVAQADHALYLAKQAGKSRLVVYRNKKSAKVPPWRLALASDNGSCESDRSLMQDWPQTLGGPSLSPPWAE